MRGFLFVACILVGTVAWGDENTTPNDHVQGLYSTQFTFDAKGDPLVSVELASHRTTVELSSPGGLMVQPHGLRSTEIRLGSNVTIKGKNTTPATVQRWTVVGQFPIANETAINQAKKQWENRGYKPRTFEIGSLFGVKGELIESRDVVIAIRPLPIRQARSFARQLGKKYHIDTSHYDEMKELPHGTLVATDGNTTISNQNILWISPQKRGQTIRIRNIEVGSGGSQLKTHFEDRRYFGSIYVAVGKDGKLTVVNSVSLETLLEGLVPSEMYPSAPMEALRSQAIAARTEMLQKLGRRHHADPFLFCSTQQCQVYSGAGKETKRTTQAVRDTRGKVLVTRKGTITDTRYSAACGGFTSSKVDTWGGVHDDSLISAPDLKLSIAARFPNGINQSNIEQFLALPPSASWEGATPWSKKRWRWTKNVTRQWFSKYASEIGPVTGIRIDHRSYSGRATQITLIGTTGTKTIIGDLAIRRGLGGLRSALFVVAPTSNGFQFRGAGFGHGVGMCQLGAIGRASSGQKHQEILRTYYKDTRLRSLY